MTMPSATTFCPSGDQAGALPRCLISRCAVPSAFMVQMLGPTFGVKRSKTIFVPSGDQFGDAELSSLVRELRSLPSAFTWQPAPLHVNAILVPSGDHAGEQRVDGQGGWVILVDLLPL